MKLFLLNITNFILSLLCHQSAAKGEILLAMLHKAGKNRQTILIRPK